ncbi:uncharacterized protein PRCAT00004125001 [Priceomyces carsonii]|uniref:uncharacterized protein n=1 Tax=Priceomyces carsonii TaxID=28549 RepID=UPI002EDB9261|nr:unnamed protein product [Priceomyces carsonii]
MEYTQATQTQHTQPTQQSPATQTQDSDINKDRICQLICTTGQYSNFDLTSGKDTTEKDKTTWVFGRNPECDLVLTTSTRLSNKHFKLWFNSSDKTMWIQDTSTNGTHLNNNRLVKGSNYMLNQGDEISVGLGIPKDVVRFVILFSDAFNPSKLSNSINGSNKDQGIYKDFIIKNETIGQGAFAIVKKAVERSTGKSYAVKIINRRKALNTGGAMVAVDRELSILRQLNHPNIVALKSFYEDLDNYYLVMELVPGGDLMDFVAANGAIGEDATQVITKQILKGITYVHNMGISHRDLKPDNILIMQDDPILVKITDFGLAKISDNSTFMKTFCGTLAYVAPEVITGKYESSQSDPMSSKYSSLVDIWSLGCLVYVLLTSHLPFNGKTQAQMFQKIKKGEFHESPLSSYEISKEGRDFLSCCLQVDPKERITAEEALKHPWLTGVDDDSQALQGLLSLSQSQSQQSRKIENGVPIKAPISKIDEDIMMRPLDSDKNRKSKANKNSSTAFKVPKRIVPLPQSQQPASQNTLDNSKRRVPSTIEENYSKDEQINSKKHHSDPSIELKRKKQKSTASTSVANEHVFEGIEMNSRDKRHEEEKSEGVKSISIPDSLENIPEDTFIILRPLSGSIFQDPIYLRQGVNPYAVGRNETCDTYINDDRMSKIHCLFSKKRHPVSSVSIYESPAHCLDDIWLLDISTNSCLVNGVVLGKGRKAQLFNGDNLEFFNDERSQELMGFKVDIKDPTGLFNGGERLPDMDRRFVNVLKQDAADFKLKPRPVMDHLMSSHSSVLEARNKRISNGPQIGGNFNPQLRQQRKNYDINRSPLKSQSSKRANLQVEQLRPTNSWI